jgi:RHS repeat-associated protein
MKNTFFLIFGIYFMAAVAHAQDDPGRSQAVTAIAGSQDSGGAVPLFQPETTPMTQTATAIAEVITPDIQNLADNLGGDPTRIFNYVHDQIRYVHYFGSKKGAQLTLLERSGNDFDQCALLAALLQAAGYPTSYGFAMLKMPYDSTNQQDLHHWLGLDFYNTNWANTSNYFAYLTGTRGNPVWYTFPPDTNTIALQRVWVILNTGGTTYYLDPAFKVSEPVAGVSLASAMQLNTGTLWTNAGGTDTGYSVTGLNESSLRTSLQACNSNLLTYLSNNAPDATVAQIIGGQQIVSSSGLPLATSLQFPIYTNSTYPLLNWTNQPTNFMGTFSITFAGTNQTWFTPQLQGQRLSFTFDSNALAQIWLDDSLVLETTNTGPTSTNTLNVILSATHPYGGGWSSSQYPIDGGVAAGFDTSSTNAYQRTNASYSIMYAFDANPAWLTERQQKLDAYLAAGYTNGSRQVTTETLNVMGLGWMVQTELAHELLCQEWNQLPEGQHRFGRMAQEKGRGYYVDVYLQLDGTLPSTSYNTPDILANNEEFDVSSYFWSAMEHGIIQQLQNSNLVAASTMKMIEIASTNSQPIYMASSSDWTSGPNVRGSLTNYGSTLSTLDGLINNGYILLLPKNGSNHVAGTGTWAGYGYAELGTTANGRSMAMIIGGGYNGGYVSDPNATASSFAPFVSQVDDSQPTFFNPQSATLPLSGQTGADPVNLVNGSFELMSSDLTLGQTEPRGLNLTRYYSSARLNSDPVGMGPGWLHSYYINAVPLSDPESGLGTTTPQQMAPMIVATCAALNLYTNSGSLDPKNWTVTALIAKWGIDQLINNAVSINLGKDTLQFSKQPDGSYTPPPNCTMSLIQTNGAYSLQERNERSFHFATNNLLANIVDQYAQKMTFAYNSNNLVTNVTDSKGRSLTFTYSGGVLTTVADSAGRSISYGYSNGDLTSYTDPEQKTTTYAYDATNELIATFDALNNLVESNFYDGFGHITTQLTQGATNKTWQIFASGYYTLEVDPAGDQRVFTYDAQSRLIASQDALGNVTQYFYDGQNHVTNTVSPLNETNQFIYDGNNNLIATVDPLGFTNLLIYDANNNLVDSIDPLGHSNTFGYNSQFSLTGSTNGNGDWTVSTFNTNGTLHTRQNSGGTTTYGYDGYGQLNSIQYPGSLGTEGFLNSAAGDILSHTNARNFLTTFQYNQRRQLTNTVAPTNLTSSLGYDAVGNLQSTTDARHNSTSYTWSVTRHKTGTTFPSTPQGTPVVTNSYDGRDWMTQTLNPLQEATCYSNNSAHELIGVANALRLTNTMIYDADGHLTNSTDAALETTSQTYDRRGETITITDPATKVIGKTYDQAGNLTFLTNRNGYHWQFQYDGANRLTNTISPTGLTSGKVFNNRGLLQSVTVAATNTATYSYDAKGRMTNRNDTIGNLGYQFDADDNLTAVTNVGQGSGLSWVYDAYDRPGSCTDLNGNQIQYFYDANGNLTNLVYPGNLSVKYYYDNLNRLTTVIDWAGRQTTNTYDLGSELTSVSRPNGTIRTVAYDAAGETTNIVERYVNGAMAIDYFAESWNNAARMQWEFVAPLPHPFTPPSRTMTYDHDNRLATFNGNNVTIDGQGNMTYGPGTNNTLLTYNYDARNRLTSAGGLTYGYNPAGSRTSLTNGSTNETFVVDPKTSQVLMRIKPGVTNYYIYGAGLQYEIDVAWTNTTILYYHFDSHGSTVALTDTNGNITDRMEYGAYGMVTYRLGTNDTPFLYNGRFGVQTDPNGLLFMRARYYNPYICRFVNADPSGFAGGLNMYAFADGNPISEQDPFGLWAGLDDLAFTGGGAVLGALSAGISGLISGHFTWTQVGYGAVAGAAAGETTLYAGPIAGGAVLGGLNSILNQSLNMANGNAQSFNYGAVAGSAVLGGLAGAVGEAIPMPVISGLNAGQGSYQAVSSAILTKLENGTIQNISGTTAAKIFLSETYNDIPGAISDGILAGANESSQGENSSPPNDGITSFGATYHWNSPQSNQSSSTGKP